ncbi:MAG: four helix bundle protein [bacterium]
MLTDKSFRLVLDIIDLYKYPGRSKKEYVLSIQVLSSGTSIGANAGEITQLSVKIRKILTSIVKTTANLKDKNIHN